MIFKKNEWNIKNIWYFCTQNTGGTPPKNRISQIINKTHIFKKTIRPLLPENSREISFQVKKLTNLKSHPASILQNAVNL